MELWPLITIVGPILFVAVLAWALWRNKQSKIPKSVTETATRRLYAEEEQASRDGTDGKQDAS